MEFAQRRLSVLSESLGDKPYLDGERFTPGDLMMKTVLRILKHTDIVTSHKRLAADVDRCTAHGLPSSERWMLRLAISERPYSRRSLIGPVKAVALFRWLQIERIRNGKEHDLRLVR